MFTLHLLRLLEYVKESGFVSKCNPVGELSLGEHLSSPPVPCTSAVHQSSPVIVDYNMQHVNA